MKILITGANGYLGKLLSAEFVDHDLILWSRSGNSAYGKINRICKDLDDSTWWSAIQLPDNLDVVIHLAEVVKINKSKDNINNIIFSHNHFLTQCCKNVPIVIYPDTAYKYDTQITTDASAYLGVKISVIEQLRVNKNFYHPVIHPILNGAGALAALCMMQKKIPYVNIFCDFDAEIPYSTESSLLNSFNDLLSGDSSLSNDWYCGIAKISNLMLVKSRMDIFWMSSLLKIFISFFKFHPSVNILIRGRRIVHSSEIDKGIR